MLKLKKNNSGAKRLNLTTSTYWNDTQLKCTIPENRTTCIHKVTQLLTGTVTTASLLQEPRHSVQHQVFLRVSVPDGGMWFNSRSGRFTSRWKDTGMHWMGVWEGYITGLNTTENRKIPWASREKLEQFRVCLVRRLLAIKNRTHRRLFQDVASTGVAGSNFCNDWTFQDRRCEARTDISSIPNHSITPHHRRIKFLAQGIPNIRQNVKVSLFIWCVVDRAS